MKKMIVPLLSAVLVTGLAAPAFADEARPADRDRREFNDCEWRGYDGHDSWRYDRDHRRGFDRDDRGYDRDDRGYDRGDWRRDDRGDWRRDDRGGWWRCAEDGRHHDDD
jgi:hypothetical protein